MNSEFKKSIIAIASQISLGISASQKIKISSKPKQIIICGMGGSALAGEFIKSAFKEYGVKVPITLHKDYDLPLTITKNSLIICISFSGNTEETLSAYKKAVSSKNTVIAMASGGTLKKLAIKDRIPFVDIATNNLPPRFSVLFMLSALLGVFVNSKILPAKSLRDLRSGEKNIEFKQTEEDAQSLSEKIGIKTPLIYSSSRLSSLGYFTKIAFNENSKIHSFFNVLPETQHNEIQGFSDKSSSDKFYSLFIKDPKDSKRISKRIDIMTKLLEKNGFDYFVINLHQKNIFQKIIFILFFGYFASIETSGIKGIDPISTPLIDELKNALKS